MKSKVTTILVTFVETLRHVDSRITKLQIHANLTIGGEKTYTQGKVKQGCREGGT